MEEMEEDGKSSVRLERPRKPKVKQVSSEQIRNLAEQFLLETPSVQRKTLRDHIFALKEDIIQKRKDGIKLLDLAFAYKKAYDAFSPTEASLDYVAKLISEVSKEAMPPRASRKPSGQAGQTARSQIRAIAQVPSRNLAEETLTEARRLREERTQSGAKPSPFPPGYVDRNLDDL